MFTIPVPMAAKFGWIVAYNERLPTKVRDSLFLWSYGSYVAISTTTILGKLVSYISTTAVPMANILDRLVTYFEGLLWI